MVAYIPRISEKTQQRRDAFDAGLDVLEALADEHGLHSRGFSEEEIAFACGVSQQAINQMVRRALKKVEARVRAIRKDETGVPFAETRTRLG